MPGASSSSSENAIILYAKVAVEDQEENIRISSESSNESRNGKPIVSNSNKVGGLKLKGVSNSEQNHTPPEEQRINHTIRKPQNLSMKHSSSSYFKLDSHKQQKRKLEMERAITNRAQSPTNILIASGEAKFLSHFRSEALLQQFNGAQYSESMADFYSLKGILQSENPNSLKGQRNRQEDMNFQSNLIIKKAQRLSPKLPTTSTYNAKPVQKYSHSFLQPSYNHIQSRALSPKSNYQQLNFKNPPMTTTPNHPRKLIAPTSVRMISQTDGLFNVKNVCQDTPDDQQDDTLVEIKVLGETRNTHKLEGISQTKTISTPRKKLDFAYAGESSSPSNNHQRHMSAQRTSQKKRLDCSVGEHQTPFDEEWEYIDNPIIHLSKLQSTPIELEQTLKKDFLPKSSPFKDLSPDESLETMKGWLKRQVPAYFISYKRVYALLHNKKLMLFTSESQEKLELCINFEILLCRLKVIGERQFSIESLVVNREGKASGHAQQVVLEAGCREGMGQWCERVREHIESSRWHQSVNLLGLSFGRLANTGRKSVIKHQVFKSLAESGDLLLFQSKTISSNLQRILTRSKYDHVAMVVRFADGRLVVFESLRETGVGICEWDRFINKKWNELYTRVTFRKLEYKRPQTGFASVLEDFIKQTIGKPFKLNPTKLLRHTNEGDRKDKIKESKGFFCSELVATGYKRLGLLDPTMAASKYWPGDFSGEQQMKLLKGARFGEEQTIDFA
ncbi:hypothetical protein FGO68_gene10927 [Halteria grandinella]|uniref:PH domain-containing protein n=1 Tax=Halteria grandinella TaxID=5974 RepID=A0A8J8NYK7_HALGN|nr:hypothetical protein FGO68_gene10927 [Halteria grandinella]